MVGYKNSTSDKAFVCFELMLALHPSQQFFRCFWTFPGLKLYKTEDKVSCSKTQHCYTVPLVRLQPATSGEA